MNALPQLQPRYTYADYRDWPAEVSGELIDGLFYGRRPEGALHRAVVGGIYRQWCAALCGRRPSPLATSIDVLPTLAPGGEADDVDCVVRPDVFIVCDRSRLRPRYVAGAPEVVVEVLSPASARKDQVQKLALYESAGVAEYWLVHPQDRVLTIYSQAGERRYGRPCVLPAEGRVPLLTLPRLCVDFEPIFAG